MTRPQEVAAGPWRIAPRFRVAVLAGTGDLAAAAAAARLGAALGAAGLPLTDARAVPPGGLRAFLARSAASECDVLVLDARTNVTPHAVEDLRRVADLDPMIAAVQPRFADTPQGDLPNPHPELDYVLVPDGRCSYLKASALALLDGLASGEGGDDIVAPLLALNRLGFRVVVAGGAAALHPDGRWPGEPATIPADWRPALARHLGAAGAVADALLDGLRPGPDGRRAVAFDFSHVGPSHSGTTGLARALVRRAAARWTDLSLHVVATADTFAFHLGDLGEAVTRADPADARVFAALVRFGQPFLWGEIDAAARRAPVLVLFMLDTIGFDCRHDAPDELDALWRFCLAEVDGLLFNSAFTLGQFARRFAMPPDTPSRLSLHALDLADYRIADMPDAPADGTILLIGNGLPHKRLAETAALVAAAGLGRPVKALGLPPGAVPGVASVPSGDVAPGDMVALYAAAHVVVYPSVYEGFGFPVLDALAHRRPILVRGLAPYDEIAAGLPERANIHRFADDADLLRRLADPPRWTEERAPGPRPRGWDDAADDLRAVIDAALAGASRARVIRRVDLLRGRMNYMRARAFDDAVGADELDRLAGLSGRVVQAAVLWLGRHVYGMRALLAAAHRLFDRIRARGA